ncbi:MAG: hypothetical protein Q9163_001088 [Psora crenata]
MTPYKLDVPVLDTYQAIVSAYSDFLTVAIHTILYERNIYPQSSFLKARKYDYPVRQNRHPKLCKWIHDAVAAVEVQMLKCTIEQTSLIIHAPPPTSAPLERYVFSTASFPRIPASEIFTPFDTSLPTDPPPGTNSADGASQMQLRPVLVPVGQQEGFRPPQTSNLPEQFRATLARLAPAMARLAPLPEDCSFTLAIELRDADGLGMPIFRGEGNWIAAEPGLQRERSERAGHTEMSEIEGADGAGRKRQGRDLGGVRTTPVRALDAGPFAMEVWVEEGRGKFEASAKDAKGEDVERDGMV